MKVLCNRGGFGLITRHRVFGFNFRGWSRRVVWMDYPTLRHFKWGPVFYIWSVIGDVIQ